MEWLIVVILIIAIFFITRKYDSEIKMLNSMIELNRNAIDENIKNKPKIKKSTEGDINTKKRVGKKSAIKKSPAKKKISTE
ncbi:MAG: hypothetical protein LBL65_03585 [Campylobacteraceae bacterium]|jgi:predicted Holliday junction resolvase-like endonuclease|nr:hypothetical protein [Campylobacteraceae bacterium]